MILAVTPAENRSLKFWAYVPPAKVSATLYVPPVPSGWSTVYTGWFENPKLPTWKPKERDPPEIGKARPAHVYLVSAT